MAPYSERQAEGEDRRREGAGDEVLDRRLAGARVAPQVAGEHVGGQRHELERDEEGDDVGAHDHADHAGDDEQEQAVELAARRLAPRQIGVATA